MARNGTGTYDLPEAPFVYDTVISETAVNSNFSDIASALTQSLSKDGQTTPTANLPMGDFRHTGVGNGTARTHYGSVGQIQDDSIVWCGTAGGTANALTLTPTPSITAYATGQRFRFKAGASPSDDAVTIAVSGLTAKAAEFDDAALSSSIVIEADKYYECLYDGTAFQISRLSKFLPAFGTAASLNVGTSENNLVQLGAGGTLPAVSGANLTDTGFVAGNVLAAHEGLIVKYATAATVDIDAGKIVVTSSTGVRKQLSSVNLTVDITASGANGLDTGSEASGTWYYIYTIYNPTTDTTAGLLSASPTAPTLPAGFTFSGLVGAVYNDGSSDFRSFYQRGNRVTQALVSVLSSGISTTFATVSLASAVPANATAAAGTIFINTSSGTANVNSIIATAGSSTTATYGAWGNFVEGLSTGGLTANYPPVIIETPQQFVYRVTGTNAQATINIGYYEF